MSITVHIRRFTDEPQCVSFVVHWLNFLADGRVDQLLLLAHHRGSGGDSEASELWVEDDCRRARRLRRAGRRAFRRSGSDGCRDGAIFQPSCKTTVRRGVTEEVTKTHTLAQNDYVGVDVEKG